MKDFIGRCLFHQDGEHANFIVTPDKGLFHCMACGKAGNVIQFVQQHDGVSFRHAFDLLRQGGWAVFTVRRGPLGAAVQSHRAETAVSARCGSGRRGLVPTGGGLLPRTVEAIGQRPRLSRQAGVWTAMLSAVSNWLWMDGGRDVGENGSRERAALKGYGSSGCGATAAMNILRMNCGSWF